jgi:hypothetical protein
MIESCAAAATKPNVYSAVSKAFAEASPASKNSI